MFSVLLVGKISNTAADLLTSEGFKVDLVPLLDENSIIAIIKDYDAIIIRSATIINKNIIDKTTKLKLIVKAGSGYNNIDLEAAYDKSIVVQNCPDSITNSVVEFTIAQLLLLSKKIIIANTTTKNGQWNKASYKSRELKDKNLGIIGFGRIGRKVSVIAKSLGMHVLAFDPNVNDEIMQKYFADKVDFDFLICQSDFITLHLPFNEETKDLINKNVIKKMKKTVGLINNSRGGIVNEVDLANAIVDRKISNAAIDVWSNEPTSKDNLLFDYDATLCTPHIAGSTYESQEQVGLDAANQIIDAFMHKKFLNVVNNRYELKE